MRLRIAARRSVGIALGVALFRVRTHRPPANAEHIPGEGGRLAS
jgi:hypothetical protein